MSNGKNAIKHLKSPMKEEILQSDGSYEKELVANLMLIAQDAGYISIVRTHDAAADAKRMQRMLR